ncbi:MAG: SCO family protein [Cephaloticoccus sp.]|nr:SCO family protein [Cephaloticoccus sp.]MCF7759155.1 SCO family protein [Cephaloticoccus sp.]
MLILFAASGCARSDADKPAATEATAPAEKRYPLRGEILSVDTKQNVLIVQHEEIPDYMPAMTMEFSVSAGDAANAQEGQRIKAEVIPSDTGHFRLENIWPDDAMSAATLKAGEDALRQDTLIRGNSPYREVGENLPDFVLYDQTGAVVQSARFRGKQIMLNFIYTRCPVATMCPAATMKMMATQELARKTGVPNLELVSITLDPEHDSPGVLRDYAKARDIDTSNFSFLTGPERSIKDLLTQFGVIAQFEGSIIKHTLTTLLINENGRIIHRADGTLWDPKDFVAKMRK